MIKFKYSFPKGFQKRLKSSNFLKNALSQQKAIYAEVKKLSQINANFYSSLFNESFILSLVFCPPKRLSRKISEIYEKYPLLADRYNPHFNFRSYDLNFDVDLMKFKIDADVNIVFALKDKVIIELDKIRNEKSSILAKYFSIELKKATRPVKIYQICCRIRNVHLGTTVTPKDVRNSYPLWFDKLQKIFNYEALRTEFGQAIIESSSLKICPYCNKRDIEITYGKYVTARPDLDHFYPKSRYPFLATTLYNLVPACSFCNQKFKSSKDTYMTNMHPLLAGTRDYKVFSFIPLLDKPPIILLNGSAKFVSNIKLFELEAEYQKDTIKREYKSINDKYESFKGILGPKFEKHLNTKKNVVTMFDIGGDRNIYNTSAYKFKLDVLSTLTNKNYRN
ncbi:HNH endonuclease [Pseudoalteromonas sp. ND6B]|uniref:HNH endonuclease n=1 Tax=Pseudoalteromonas sp. ND6B TaxID=1535421 RepID=UPI00051A1961|nr:HNH endonuclease domain-containing protein [Pseudoalteromonas sp. ND6B]KGK02781.1 CRISPR-related HNH endonuclease domain [Pseudoalteromonas sp. ND6B]